MKERGDVQTPPLNARAGIGRVPRVLALVAFLVGTVVSSFCTSFTSPSNDAA